jgi:predicted TPR repeat methyltransferase
MATPQPDPGPSAAMARAVRLQQAVAAHQAGDLDAAEAGYAALLEQLADDPLVLNFYGLLCHQRGRNAQGMALLQQAIQRMPRHAEAHFNLGAIHIAENEFAQAEEALRQACACAPTLQKAFVAHAAVLERLNRWGDAHHSHRALLALPQTNAQAHLALAEFLLRRPERTAQHLEEAVQSLRSALALDLAPGDVASVSRLLARALDLLGYRDQAVAACRAWLQRQPEDPSAVHALASYGGAPPPERASDGHLSALFDRYAEHFDTMLVGQLAYRAPELLAHAIAAFLPPPTAALDVLDAGCGTGLCGPLVQPWARHLTGVDISAGMLAKAKERGVYHALERAELTAYLQATRQKFDLIVSADVLIYFGELGPLLTAAFHALRPGGWLAVTAELLDGAADSVDLPPTGRYRHSRRHLHSRLAAAGFTVLQTKEVTLRTEASMPVLGLVTVARRGP